MEDLSVYILAKDEAENVGPLMDSLAGVRDVVVLDNGSTDGTQEMFKARGARVYDGTTVGKHTVTEADVVAFHERFGFDPGFTPGDVYDHSGDRKNHAATLCRNDWMMSIDCDERPVWDVKKVRQQLDGKPGLCHQYVHKHNPDGTPLIEFIQCRLYNRQKAKWTGRIHEVIVSGDAENPAPMTDYTPDLVIHHWQKDKAWRGNHADQLEYQALMEETPRNLHYLGREYVAMAAWDKALAVYDLYFSVDRGDFPEQIAQVWMTRAEVYRTLERIPEAIEAYHRAMVLDDSRRDPFFFLGTLYLQQEQIQKAFVWFMAASAISFNPIGFMNDISLYTWRLHDNLAVCYYRMGLQDLAQYHWLEALKHLPEGEDGERILGNGKYMMKKVNSEK